MPRQIFHPFSAARQSAYCENFVKNTVGSAAEQLFDLFNDGKDLRFGRYEVDFVERYGDFDCSGASWVLRWKLLRYE
jgi:hypothetical protein